MIPQLWVGIQEYWYIATQGVVIGKHLEVLSLLSLNILGMAECVSFYLAVKMYSSLMLLWTVTYFTTSEVGSKIVAVEGLSAHLQFLFVFVLPSHKVLRAAQATAAPGFFSDNFCFLVCL